MGDLSFYTTVDTCLGVIRNNQGILESCRVAKDAWEPDGELAAMFIGELEVERISEEKTQEIIERMKKTREKRLLGKVDF